MKLLKIEWLKYKSHKFFWIGLGLYVLCMILLITQFGGISLSQGSGEDGEQGGMQMQSFGEAGFYKLPYLWHHITYLAGFFKFIPAFLLVFFVANEFSYKTYRQNIIDGLSIGQFYTSKVISAVLFALLSVVIIAVTGFLIALSHNEGAAFVDYFQGTDYLLAFFTEVLFIIIFAIFLTVLFKRSSISMIVILAYYFLIEPLIGYSLGPPYRLYLPTEPSREMILQPFTRLMQVDTLMGLESPERVRYKFLLITLGYTLVLAVGGYLVLKKRDV